MNDSIYIAWQDDSTRSWHTIAKLIRFDDGYEFAFTEGIRKLKNIPHQLFSMPLKGRYRSSMLIPLFQSRLPSRSRTDFEKIQEWLDLSGTEDEFTRLGKFGLIPGTDSLMLYPSPTIIGNEYRLDFFVHGVRYMSREASNKCEHFDGGETLLPLFDVQNPVDPNAVALRTTDQYLIGYVPTFYAEDFRKLFQSPRSCLNSKIFVKKCNADAPAQLRLLCSIRAFVEPAFKSMNTKSHQPISAGELMLPDAKLGAS